MRLKNFPRDKVLKVVDWPINIRKAYIHQFLFTWKHQNVDVVKYRC